MKLLRVKALIFFVCGIGVMIYPVILPLSAHFLLRDAPRYEILFSIAKSNCSLFITKSIITNEYPSNVNVV